MSNETMEKEEQELKAMEEQLIQADEAEKEKAAKEDKENFPAPSPEPEPAKSPEVQPEPAVQPAPVTPNPSEGEKPKDNPMEWAQKKGFKTPEDMARALLQKEQEFHQSRQKAAQQPAPPPQPEWTPTPQMGNGYNYPLPQYFPPQPRLNPRDLAHLYPNLAPEDLERMLPPVIDVAKTIMAQERAMLEQRFGHIERTTARNNELMTLMQDPAFRDERVQREIHAVLDSDPTIYQRERNPHAFAFEKALGNLARKQLQQGIASEDNAIGTKPPVTAGGGNGSFVTQRKITEREIAQWSIKDQEAFFASNGRVIPKK